APRAAIHRRRRRTRSALRRWRAGELNTRSRDSLRQQDLSTIDSTSLSRGLSNRVTNCGPDRACLAAYEVHPLFTAALNQSIKASIVGLCSQSQNIVHLLIVTAYLRSHCKAPAVGLPPLQELGQTSVPWRSIMKALIA